MNNKKIILVTGGTSGIGLGTVEYLLEQGIYEIISLSRGDRNLSLAKEKLGNNSDKVTFLQGDISNEEDCRKIYEKGYRNFSFVKYYLTVLLKACKKEEFDNLKAEASILFPNNMDIENIK